MLALTPVAAVEPNSPALAPVTTFFAYYNRHDIHAASAFFDQDSSVTDAFPPFRWRGKNAFTEWMSDLDSYNTSNRYTDYDFKVGKPLTNDVEGGHANVIVPVVLDLKHDGKPERFDGLVNVVLQGAGTLGK
jgi:hypothetical protein